MSYSLEQIAIFCPAKLNLFLHVTGKREDGYHLLDSLVCFTDFGDTLTFSQAKEFQFTLWQEESVIPLLPDKNNLVVKAVKSFERLINIDVDCHIHLHKKIPIGAGLGGGSSNAAGTLKGLEQFYNYSIPQSKRNDLLIELGADVPVCYTGKSCYFSGIGEIITPLQAMPNLYAVILHPHIPCSTAAIFQTIQPPYNAPINNHPETFTTTEELFDFLQTTENDLTTAATTELPIIRDMLNLLNTQQDCLLSRMSGSGSACFGLFSNLDVAVTAATKIKQAIPTLWVQACSLS